MDTDDTIRNDGTSSGMSDSEMEASEKKAENETLAGEEAAMIEEEIIGISSESDSQSGSE